MMPEPAPGWDCEAYGPEGRDVGAVCFVAGELGRCATPGECHEIITAERQRVYRRIQELAAEGDETGVFLAGEFTSPGQLLNGGDDAGPDRR